FLRLAGGGCPWRLRGPREAAAVGCYASVVTQNGPEDTAPPRPAGEGGTGPCVAEPGDPADPDRSGTVDLLGLLAYASLVAFFRLAEDAALAASLEDKADLAEMAAA